MIKTLILASTLLWTLPANALMITMIQAGSFRCMWRRCKGPRPWANE
jgi:hypothetical protein